MSKLSTIYIISKGRPHCTTAKVLAEMKYSGEWYIVCGNNDETISQYIKEWGEKRIIMFDWYKEVKESDLLDNFGVEKMSSGAVPVRNAVRKISEERGELRHWQFDDDYYAFGHITKTYKKYKKITDGLFFQKRLEKLALFAHKSGIANVGFALAAETYPDKCTTVSKRVFNAHNLPNDFSLFTQWRGRMNDDTINALDICHTGKISYSFRFMNLTLKPTQPEKGGLTDLYQKEGTVRKTAYSILVDPQVRLVIRFGRYHHKQLWRNIMPRLIHQKYAKV